MTHINQRRDTAANWASRNPVLQLGEVGWEVQTPETDGPKCKVGDGVTAWNDLPYSRGYGTAADVGLDQVDNTSDADKPISDATQTALDSKANLASPNFTGNPTAPTPSPSDNDTSLATTAFVQSLVTGLAPTASPTFTGDPKAPTPTAGDNDTSIATTAFVATALDNLIDSASGSIRIGTMLIQWGTVSYTFSSQTNQTQTATFPTAFSGTPAVWLTLQHNFSAVAFVGNVVSTGLSATSVDLKAADSTFTARSGSFTGRWLAIGPA